jgi:NAD(P)-dependent dehydrogenase (short-subunit alcohol dehydrogenase family)
MKELAGRVAIITGAGRGIGREHALYFAEQGAAVVVNDLGGSSDGSGNDQQPAQSVVDEILAAGGSAVADHSDVADTDGANDLIATAIAAFGRLDVLVNNAGILRDRMLINLSDEEWDTVIRVHMRGHFMTMRAASRYWRDRSKAGEAVRASIVNTTSTSGLLSNLGQSNYGAAKSAIATMTTIANKELSRYGVRCNAVAPAARTRLTLGAPNGEARYAAEPASESSGWRKSDPDNISPFVAYLATETCPIAGKIFFVYGNEVRLFQPWTLIDRIATEEQWTVPELRLATERWADVEFDDTIPVDR